MPASSTTHQNIDFAFDDGFFDGVGASGSPIVPYVAQVSIDGHPYIIDPSKYQRATVPLRRESTDESVEPGEQCADEDTEILTTRGWLKHDRLLIGDTALTLNMDTGLAEWHPVEDISRYDRADFPMWSMEGRGHSSLTTLNHRWPCAHRVDHGNGGREWAIRIHTSEELNRSDNILTAADVANLPAEKKYEDDFVELVAWYWTEGNVTLNHRKDRVRRVTISQHPGVNPGHTDRIRACLTRLMGTPNQGQTWYEYENPHNGVHLFHIHRGHFEALLDVAPDKVVSPEFISYLTREQLELFIDVSVKADGWQQGKHVALTQADPARVDAFQMACVLAGRRTNRLYEKAPQSSAGWRWKVSASSGRVRLNPWYNVKQGSFKIETVEYTGTIWCPTTKTQTWCARRDGHVYFTGNTLNTGGAWRRSQDNWFMGAGQEYLDNRFAFVSVYTNSGESPSIRTRFWRSKGMDPFSEGGLSLLPEQTLKGTSSATSQFIEAIGSSLFWWDGTNLKVSTNPTAGTPTWTTITAPLSLGSWPTVLGMTTDGSNLYLALGPYGVGMVAAGSSTATVLRPTAPQPTLSVTGTPGTTSYSYYVVATDANGFKSLVSTVRTITTGPSSLSAGDAILISWTAVSGAVSYDVLKTDTAHTIGTTTATSFTDDGTHSSVAYTAPTNTTETIDAGFVGYGNGFLLAAAGPLLAQVDSNGMTTLVKLHFNADFIWTACCGAPTAIYVAGAANGLSELYGIQVSTTTFGLSAPYIAGQVSDGEIINDLTYYQGVVILSTSVGVRTAQDTNSNGQLTTGAVIDDLGGSLCCSTYGNFVWFGTSDFSENDGIYSGTAVTSGLGRLFLSEFSSALLPAYATDVMASNGVSGNTVACTIYNGTPFFAVAASGVWGPSGNFVSYGYLEAGWVRYGTVEDKILVSTDLRHDPLPGGASVTLQVVPFNGQEFVALSSTTQGSIGPDGPVSAGNPVGEAFHVIVQMNRATVPTLAPILRRWTSRAIIIAARQDQIIVPIMWRDEVMTPIGDGSPFPMDLEYEWQFLKGLETAGSAFIYQEGGLSYIAQIDQIEIAADSWNDTKTMLQGLCMVKLLTVA